MSFQDLLEEYCTQLRRRQIEGSLPCAKRTAELMRQLVTSRRHVDAAALIDDVRSTGVKLQEAKPVELAVGNIVRRVLHIIREEAVGEVQESLSSFSVGKPPAFAAQASSQLSFTAQLGLAAQTQPGLLSLALQTSASFTRVFPRAVSLSNLLDVSITDLDKLLGSEAAGAALGGGQEYAESEQMSMSGKRKGVKIPQWRQKHAVIESLNELIEELDNIQNAIIVQGVEHIHANEVILTFGFSETTYRFLQEAAKKREFQVVVAEGAPAFDGHAMAKKLAGAGIQTTVISDAAVFAMMARANKVLVGAHAVLANGGVVAPVGIHMVALAAKKHSIPFVVLVGLHKLSPQFPHDHDLTYNEFKSPADVADFDLVADAFAQQQARTAQCCPTPADTAAPGPASAAQQQQSGGTTPSGSAAGTPGPSGGGGGFGAGASGPGGRSALSQLLSTRGGSPRGSPPLGPFGGSFAGQQGGGGGAAGGSGGGGGGASGTEACGPSWPGSFAGGGASGVVHVPNPMFDYIPPHLVSLFVTDTGGYVPSYVYRLLTEYYSREDYSLAREPEPAAAGAAAGRRGHGSSGGGGFGA